MRYLREPFRATEDSLSAVTSVNYDGKELFARAMPPQAPARPPAEQLIEITVERLKAQFQPQKIVLFGSHARGEANEHSDVDLLVVVDDERYQRDLDLAMRRALSDVRVPKDIVVASAGTVERYGELVGTVYRPALREGGSCMPKDDATGSTTAVRALAIAEAVVMVGG
jgi:predicted nucleotidyltransferase